MMPAFATLLPERGVLRIDGPEAVGFLQGLVSNDVTRAAPDRAVYAALLTPQGRYLHDFLIVADGEALLLDCEAERREDLMQRLRRYRLRSKVTIEDATGERAVIAAVPGAIPGGFPDPRLAALGWRAVPPREVAAEVLRATGLSAGTPDDYDRHRLALGVPDGSHDLPPERALLLENGFEELNGVDFAKGCYVGQELTARTKYRALVRKRLLPVRIEGPIPAPGSIILHEGREAGEMRSSSHARGLALIRLEAWRAASAAGTPLTSGAARIIPEKPDWMRLPEPSAA